MARATSANKETIIDFLVSLVPCMQNLTSLPSQCYYNVDETGVTVVTKPTGVVTQVGQNAVYSIAAAKKGNPILS